MSTRPRIYLDYNATAPLVEPARAAIADAMADVGNPSSVHAEGRRARDRVERARAEVATLVGRPREQIVFTSGGTEANQLGVLALAAAAEKRGLPKIVATTTIEHPSLVGAVAALRERGWSVHDGAVPSEVGLVAIGLVNHELGTIAHLPRAPGALVHIDAVQAAGKLALDGVVADSIAISAHKIGGPQGVGALAISIDEGLPLVDGGHQERGRRPGTENVLGIVGFGAAARAARSSDWSRVRELGERLERGLLSIEGTSINGGDRERVGGTINAEFAGARGESIVIALDLQGVALSTGAACTSGSVQPSPVLLALGRTPEQARAAVRFSLGRPTTAAEIDRVLELLPSIVERARRYG
jgi:cysteine desulfurase